MLLIIAHYISAITIQVQEGEGWKEREKREKREKRRKG